MPEFFVRLFDTTGFPPRRYCGEAWTDAHAWTHIVSDIAIFGAYASIPVLLLFFVLKRKDTPFPPVFWLFAAFILTCGVGHLVEATIFWHPWYRFSGLLKCMTAIVSWATVLALIPILPKALSLPGLSAINKQLENEIKVRKGVEQRLLEQTADLRRINEDLKAERERFNTEIEQRRRAESRYQDLYDNSPDYYASVDAQSAVIEQCNLTLANAIGMTRFEIIGQSIYELYHPDSVTEARQAFEQFRSTGAVHNAELQLRHKNGRKIDVILNATAVRDQSGNIIRTRSVWHDVTDRKRLEQRFRTMFESAPTAMVMINTQGNIVLVNALTESLFRCPRSELLGKPIEVLVPGRFRQEHPKHRDQFFAFPQARRMGAGRDLFGLRKDESEFPVEIGLNPIETEEGLFVLSAIVNITERKKIEEQASKYAAELKQSNEELEQFAYSASHDLRAPLRAIDQLAEWILEDNADVLPSAAMDDVKLIRSRAKRMVRLLEDLLMYSRAGRKEGMVEIIDCGLMVREIAELVGPTRGISIQVDDLPTVETHRAPLEQVFRNLISNAIKHHDRDEGCVRVRGSAQGEYVQFEIEDDGPGIPPKHHEQIFGMFQTLQPRDKVESSGMGLALVKKIVESRGGTITVDSKEGVGATFRFTWKR